MYVYVYNLLCKSFNSCIKSVIVNYFVWYLSFMLVVMLVWIATWMFGEVRDQALKGRNKVSCSSISSLLNRRDIAYI